MQHHAAQQLDVEMALAEGPLRRLAHRREGLDQQIVEGLAGGEALAELIGAGKQVDIRERFELRLQRVDGIDGLFEGLDDAVVGRAEQPLGKSADQGARSSRGGVRQAKLPVR
jgi:hypothetical protein